MKRAVAALLLCLLLVAPAAAVWADLIIEPDNDFYTRHRGECVQVYRTFTANGELAALTEPGGEMVETLPAGGEVFISFTYRDAQGREWGIYMADGLDGHWLPMDGLSLVYDNIAFQEDHAQEFYPYAGSYDLYRAGTGNLIPWTYPGSGRTAGWTAQLPLSQEFSFQYAYRDSLGREWGFWGDKVDVWICISDPFSTTLAVDNDNPGTGVWVSPEYPRTLPLPAVAAILVTALAAGTALLIKLLWKPVKEQ